MQKLDLECIEYISQDGIDNIENNYKKIIGIESNLNLINENKKNVGRVLLLTENKKIFLNMIVEFNGKKIKWEAHKNKDDKKFVLVDPYFVKPYSPNPKLEVPTKIFDPKSGQIVTEVVELTYNQFMKSRLLDFYGEFKHRLIAAYDNFYYLMKNNQYYFAINSTVRHYKVSQDELKKVISIVNNQKKKIKKEWDQILRIHYHQNQKAREIDDLYKEFEKPKKVIQFKK